MHLFLPASVGLHLLDFDLFTHSEAERRQAVWRFEMRDETQPEVTLGNIGTSRTDPACHPGRCRTGSPSSSTGRRT
ncbi:hypothetical protein [Ectothiorhodospira variabilis]|uniref:hypothetical protein n=1 Tax=Ectothiorhodospira variabilis TaxID=505694 RepID=UPI0030841047